MNGLIFKGMFPKYGMVRIDENEEPVYVSHIAVSTIVNPRGQYGQGFRFSIDLG